MILVDANNYIKRIYHSGQDPYEMFLNFIDSRRDQRIEVVCDTSTSREARREIYPDYKKGRNTDSDPVYFTIYDNIVTIAQHFDNCVVVKVNRGEADDYIMTRAESGDTVISNDKDLWPLVGRDVSILIAGSTKVDRQLIESKFHYPDPELIYVNKALVGDSSDKIKGKMRFGKAAYAKLTREQLYYIKDRLETNGTGMAQGDDDLDALANDESVKLSWKLVNQMDCEVVTLPTIHTPLQDFLDANDINILGSV